MTVRDLIDLCNLRVCNESDLDREVCGVYAGDLLSWVMGHGEEGQCLVTIMSNQNVLAVASLLDFSAVILSEGVEADADFLKLAQDKEINILSSRDSTYVVCTKLYEALK